MMKLTTMKPLGEILGDDKPSKPELSDHALKQIIEAGEAMKEQRALEHRRKADTSVMREEYSGLRVYTDKELRKLKPFIDKVTEIWRALSLETYQADGDRGTCILGDGIEIYHLPPRCRKPRTMRIISSHSVACAQGSLHYEAHTKKVIELLSKAGIEARYNYGRMD